VNKTWLVYLIECSDTTYYCGVTNNLDKRIKVHNSGKGAKYTKNRLPVKLLVNSQLMTKSEAYKLEYKVKKQRKRDKISFLKLLTINE
jgi:putative endonuclease